MLKKKDRKYKMLKYDTITIRGYKLHRIKALQSFGDVEAGSLGGYIQAEDNLSHTGNCWVYNKAKVSGLAKVRDDAKICDYAEVYDSAVVSGDTRVCDNARIHDSAEVYGNAEVYNNANICGTAEVYGSSVVAGNAIVHGNAKVRGRVRVYDFASVFGNARILDDAVVCGNANLTCNAHIESAFDYCTISGFGSEARTTTFYKCDDGKIRVICGCFDGTLKEFKKQVKETHGDNQYAKEYLAIAKIVKKKLKTEQKEEE